MRAPVIDPEQSAITMKCSGRRATPPPGMTGVPDAGSGITAARSLVERAGVVLPPRVDRVHRGRLAPDRLEHGILARGRPHVGGLEGARGPGERNGEALEHLVRPRRIELAVPGGEPVAGHLLGGTTAGGLGRIEAL